MAITGFFAEVLSRTLNDPFHRGCLLVNSALEANAEDTDLRQAVAEEFEAICSFFEGSLQTLRMQSVDSLEIDVKRGRIICSVCYWAFEFWHGLISMLRV